MEINSNTLIYASIAKPRVVLGPIMHNAAFSALGLNCIYMSIEANDLKGAINGMRSLNIQGYSVSKPFKEEVLKYIDRIDDEAEHIGAVNTVKNENGFLTGYNTDGAGAINALKTLTELENKKVIIFGAGGVAKAIAFILRKNNANVTIYNRTPKRGENLASAIGGEYAGWVNEIKKINNYDILINATSIGHGSGSFKNIFPQHYFCKDKIVLDVVFSPPETEFIKDARNAGCKVILGTKMLAFQGALQFKLFTGLNPPLEIMENAIKLELDKSKSSSILSISSSIIDL